MDADCGAVSKMAYRKAEKEKPAVVIPEDPASKGRGVTATVRATTQVRVSQIKAPIHN